MSDIVKKYAVLYTDGSALHYAKENNSHKYHTGSGMHGYLYEEEDIDKKTGNKPNHYTITDSGYLRNDELNKIPHHVVSPKCYIDWVISSTEAGTNNTAEMEAIITGLRELHKLNVTNILIKSDSMYALNILYKLMRSEDEIKILLEEVTVNKEYWLKMYDVLKDLLKDNVIIEARHVKAHTDNLGNIRADKLALLARAGSTNTFHTDEKFPFTDDFSLTDIKQYWKPKTDRHPLLSQRQMYFTNLDVVDDNGGMWYTMLKYKEEREIGKKTNHASFSIVYLKEPDEKISELLSIYKKNTKDKISVATLKIDDLYKPEVLNLYNRFKEYIYMYRKARGRNEITMLEDILLVNELYPQGLAHAAMEDTKTLHDVYNDYKRNIDNESKIFIDITKELYEETDKGWIFRKDLNDNNVGINISYIHEDKELIFPIMFSLDIMPKNNLKRIAKDNPKVILAIRNNQNVRMDYYTIVELEKTNDIVVTTNYFSNSIFINAVKKKRKKK